MSHQERKKEKKTIQRNNGFYHDIKRWQREHMPQGTTGMEDDPRDRIDAQQLAQEMNDLPHAVYHKHDCFDRIKGANPNFDISCTRCRTLYLCVHHAKFAIAMFHRILNRTLLAGKSSKRKSKQKRDPKVK
eukprot:m.160135 g.160135  ORF g.160135 m.160135 type:complete len:131 (-) comp16355_c2_seq1:397-789(-)